ncbi:primosomal protein N' [Variovorax dokdonensis]|uniref:Replication restart protein PriA n=1 Tax=Variovorax dokdonensis TaxID=344883 RepID=A0ABT7NGK2_9BURK|nr:primosomal protein N' [Variovorax dokdonensis]MDM0047067.1 primosomal protein N' [Variovorax dokdonensis]
MIWRLDIAVPTPAHSALGDLLSYSHHEEVLPGSLVRVPLGRREVCGVVWAATEEGAAGEPGDGGHSDAAPGVAGAAAEMTLRPAACVLDALPPLSAAWMDLVAFSARYYQRAIGEVALAALPPQLRELSAEQLARRLKRRATAASKKAKSDSAETSATNAPAEPSAPEPTPEQAAALDRLADDAGPFLLFGSTGSGKTEVYLRAVANALDAEPTAQALVMVPEINLTPQLEARFRERFGADAVVSLHSGMTPAQRLASWMSAHLGQARILLGTRMAVFASLPGLRLIVVDEEHDPSYKQQEGARYSARDLAIWRGRREGAKVVLGSATPSLESWHHSRPPQGEDPGGRYRRLEMPSRIGADAGSDVKGELPEVRLVDMTLQPPRTVLSAALMAAIGERAARGEQCLLLLNRRGYAPVLACGDCGWKSECPHCSAYRVFHKIDRSLRCHHCGFAERVPRACPACGNLDIAPVGRGTERLEEHLGELFEPVRRPDGSALRIGRIDADSTRHEGALEQHLAAVHAGEVDVLVGTQMIAKGHDFRRVTLVAAVQPDGALFSSDFRAPERLFALLMQSAGRAGRDAAFLAAQGSRAQMWVQTHHPRHPLFQALRQHDYPAFAEQELAERRAAGMPPFAFQALIRADARTQEAAQSFLNEFASQGALLEGAAQVSCYPAVPLAVQRVANVERAQMLVESASRGALQAFLAAGRPLLQALRQGPQGKGLVRWLVDVDPQAI